jgi:hypothetical protein
MTDSAFWAGAETRAKLSYLRSDAAKALETYLSLRAWKHPRHMYESAAISYITAQAKYTLACAEVQDDSILDYVEIPTF